MRLVSVAFTGFIFLALISCKKNPNYELLQPFHGKIVLNSKIRTDHIIVCLDSLVEDSRCPVGVVCIWQGTVIAKFSVSVNNHQQPVTLSTLKLPGFPPILF
jgi:hypothetical protein